MKIKAIIFDLDGTITEPYLDFDRLRKEIGLPANSEPLLEAMEKMSEAERKKAEEILYKHEQAAIEHSTLNKGAAETLRILRQMKMPIGVLTRNTRSNASAVAQKHNIEFDAIFDRNDGPVKPDPFGVKMLCRHFNVRPQETLVVGDYLFDLQCAKAAGATAVWMKNSEQSRQFTDFADYTIDKLTQIIDIIKQNTELGTQNSEE
ncbi:MAG: HAD family hydrolase [Phycisphaerae bacterium]|jgi:phosphoglycolate phosphatase-like HAD superfamily hydrolase